MCPELPFRRRRSARIRVTECQMVNQFKGSAKAPPQFTRGYGLVFGQSERKAMAMALSTARCAPTSSARTSSPPPQDEEFVISHCRQRPGDRLRRALKLPHYVDFQAELDLVRRMRAEHEAARTDEADDSRRRPPNEPISPRYNFAYLDEQTKRMIRRAILKAIAIPGYQVPFASREMPMPYGWGTGGVQVTASIIGPDDVLKVIDQGADDTTNAVSIRAFFRKVADVAVTTDDRGGDHHPDPPPHPGAAARATARSWSSRCRSPSRCASSSRARPRRARCMRSRNTG